MNKRQAETQKAFVEDEAALIRKLKREYRAALEEINRRAAQLQTQINQLTEQAGTVNDPEELARLQSMIQAKVYQKQYQEALRTQINGVLDTMHVNNFTSISAYLQTCYENGYVGSMYDLHGQGIPLILPMEQPDVVRAVQLDTKLSQGLYARLGEDIAALKEKVRAEISRGISAGLSYQQIARSLAGHSRIGYNNAVRIARTEGHRIQCQSAFDAMGNAVDNGADVVKQWDSTLDGRTRPSHRMMDGEIAELKERFSNDLMYPGDSSGTPEEVCNCRCALLQRARWALDEDELNTLKERAQFFGLDKSENFADFKKKYLNAAEAVAKNGGRGIIKRKIKLNAGLQFFAESDIKKQESISLRRSIRKFEKRIAEHENKINNPQEYYSDWNNFDERYRDGLKRHWNKEIRNFHNSIQNRIDELKRRGEWDG